MKGGLNNINQNHNKPEYFDELVLPVYNQSYLAKLWFGCAPLKAKSTSAYKDKIPKNIIKHLVYIH